MSKKRAHREMQKQEEELLPGHLFKPITPQDREKITNEIKATILEQRKKEEVNKKEEEEESDDDELSEITSRMTRLGSSRKKQKRGKKRKPKTNRKKHTKKRKIKKRKSTRKK